MLDLASHFMDFANARVADVGDTECTNNETAGSREKVERLELRNLSWTLLTAVAD